MTRLRSFGASAGRLRGRAFGASARHARLRLLLLVAAPGLLAQPAAAQTEIVEYYGHDALGSIRIVFTASGVATARADYEPFGEAVTIAGMPAGPLPAQQFTGQERDALERQDYFGARYYRPRHGRFSQVDPVWGNLFDPQQLNRYAYVGNSPLRHVDPDGRMRLDADCQQLDLTFAKCAAYKAPDSFLAGVFGWQQFLRQGPTSSGGDPGGRRPKGPTEGGEAADGSDGDDGGGTANTKDTTNSAQNTAVDGDDSDACESASSQIDYVSGGFFFAPLLGVQLSAGVAFDRETGWIGVFWTLPDGAPSVGLGAGAGIGVGSVRGYNNFKGPAIQMQGGFAWVGAEAFRDSANRQFTGGGGAVSGRPTLPSLKSGWGAAIGRVNTSVVRIRQGTCK